MIKEKGSKKWYKTWWGIPSIVLGSIFLLCLIIGINSLNKQVNSVDCNQSTQNLSNTIDCPKLNCSTCPTIKTDIKYVCSDGKEVASKEACVNYIDTNWDLSSNKSELIGILNQVKDNFESSTVDVTKLTISNNTIEVSYTQKNSEYQSQNVGQTMFSVLKETANYLKSKNKLDYGIDVYATTSNGGYIFYKKTTKQDVLNILNYNLGMDEWISKIEPQTVTETIYVCPDLTETKDKDDCKTDEQKEIDSSNYELVVTINSVKTARSIGEYSLENLSSSEQFVIVDFSIYNKGQGLMGQNYEFNPNYVLIEDSNGYSYSYSWESASLDKYWGGMTGVTIEYESTKSGALAFVVPKTEKNFTLIVKDFTGINGKKEFSIK